MRKPNFEELKEEIKEKPGFWVSQWTSNMHPKPNFYKYYWLIFWQGSPCDEGLFMSDEYWLTTKKAMDFIEELKVKGERCWIYNRRRPRLDPNNPFDVNSERWKGQKWAVSFDEDTDEIYKGHK